jgi:hypothetical protein
MHEPPDRDEIEHLVDALDEAGISPYGAASGMKLTWRECWTSGAVTGAEVMRAAQMKLDLEAE